MKIWDMLDWFNWFEIIYNIYHDCTWMSELNNSLREYWNTMITEDKDNIFVKLIEFSLYAK